MCRENCGRNCHRLNLHRRHDRRHHSRRAPAKACQIVNQCYLFLFFHVVLLFFSGCLRICFMSIFAHSRLIYKFFSDTCQHRIPLFASFLSARKRHGPPEAVFCSGRPRLFSRLLFYIMLLKSCMQTVPVSYPHTSLPLHCG